MKKKVLSKLFVSVITVSLLLSGCGTEKTSGNVESSQVESVKGIHITEGPKYQYQLINPDDIIVEYSGLKPDRKLSEYDGRYVTDTSVYLSDRVGVYLGEEHFEATVGEYINYIDVDFKWNVSDHDLYLLSRRQLEVSPSLFEGTITYADGYEGSIDAESVEFSRLGNTLTVKIAFRGEESVSYEIEIPDIWEDGEDLSTEDDIREWYENLGGDGSEVDESTASKVHDDWNTSVTDISNEEFYVKVKAMRESYLMWHRSLNQETLTEEAKASLNNDYTKKGDIYFPIEYRDGSDWVLLYGDSSITSVFKEAGVDYGVPCACFCKYSSDEEFYRAISDYFNMGYDFNSKGDNSAEYEMAQFKYLVGRIPLSDHNTKHLSMEEIRAYLVELYRYFSGNNDTLIKGIYYESPVLLKLFGLSSEGISQKFEKYFTFGKPSLEKVYTVYEIVVKDYNYTGSIFDFYTLDINQLDSMILQMVLDGAEEANWEIEMGIADIIRSLGGTIPEYATIVEDGSSVEAIRSQIITP